jgi:competence protein ComEC
MNSRYPFPGFVLFLALGILAGHLFGKGVADIPFIASVSCSLLICLSVLFYRKRWYAAVSVVLMLLLMMTGFLSVAFRNFTWDEQIARIQAQEYSSYQGLVKTFPERRKKSIRIELDLEQVRLSGSWEAVSSKALIYLPLNTAQVPQPGDRIVVNGQLEIPRSPLNPDEFDYKSFLRHRGILWTAFVPEGAYSITTAEKESLHPELWSLRVSKWAEDLFRTYLKDDRAYGLVKAMLLGRRDDLHTEQVDDYTASGTVHILSVSGMHVGLIFLVLRVLLGWTKTLRGGKFIYLIAVTSSLFFYALVTGFSPSVQRSMMMCVVLVIAEVFRKGNYPVNTLGFSALLILLTDPMALFEVGFQLSYAAMLGIFLFYKPIESVWKPDGWLWRNLWQVTGMSFAAQLATFPLSVYYFHQFPTYFWLINPFVILWTNLLLPAAMLLLAIAFMRFTYLLEWTGRAVEWLAYFTDLSAGAVRFLPKYLIENLLLDQMEVILLYVFILMTWWVYESRRTPMLKGMSMIIGVFAAYGVSISAQQFLQSGVVFHAIPKHSVLSVKSADTLFVLGDKKFLADSAAFQFYIQNYGTNAGALNMILLDTKEVVSTSAYQVRQTPRGTLLECGGKTIFIGEGLPGIGGINYTMVNSNRRYGNFGSVQRSSVVLAGEMSVKGRERWKTELNNRNLDVRDLMISGALSIR